MTCIATVQAGAPKKVLYFVKRNKGTREAYGATQNDQPVQISCMHLGKASGRDASGMKKIGEHEAAEPEL